MNNNQSSNPNVLKHLTVEQLKVNVYEDRPALGKAASTDAASKLKQLLQEKARVRVIFAAAPSQNEFLQTLGQTPGIDWSRITAFHMDEYIGLKPQAPQAFGQFLRERIFQQVNPGEVHYIISEETFNGEIVGGSAADIPESVAAACDSYSQ